MMKMISVDGIHLWMCEYDCEEVKKCIKEDAVVQDGPGWEIEDSQKYTVEELVADADHYFSMDPPDLDKCAGKLWIASVSVLKAFYYSIGVHFKSKKSLEYLRDLAIDSYGTGDRRWHLRNAWTMAEEFHNLSRDEDVPFQFHSRDFPTTMKEVKNFIKEFQLIDKESVLKEFKKLIGQSDQIKIEAEEGEVLLGGHTYNFVYSVC